jgi:hypothetical protein
MGEKINSYKESRVFQNAMVDLFWLYFFLIILYSYYLILLPFLKFLF